MTTKQFLISIRERHRDCCLTRDCEDEGCRVDLSGINPDSLVILHGEQYRDAHGDRNTRIADRLALLDRPGLVVAVMELKGGRRWIPLTDAVEQIQMGMKAAEELLFGYEVAAWYPLLISSCRRLPQYRQQLHIQRNRVSFRHERPKVIEWKDCDSHLDAMLNELS